MENKYKISWLSNGRLGYKLSHYWEYHFEKIDFTFLNSSLLNLILHPKIDLVKQNLQKYEK